MSKSGNDTANRTILAVTAFIVLAGLIYWFLWDDAPFTTRDSNDYMNVAQDLRDRGLDEIHLRGPGYPLLLLLTGSASEPSRMLYLVQLSMHLVSVFMISLFLIRYGVRGFYLSTFAVLALLPPVVVSSAYVLTEALTEFLVVAGTFLLLFSLEKGRVIPRAALMIASGLAFGFAAAVKPTYQLVFIVISLIMILLLRFGRKERRRWLPAILAVFAVPLVMIGGLYIYNHNKLGYVGLTPSFGYHFSTKTARVVERLPDEYADVREILVSNRDTILVERYGRHTGENYIWLAKPELERITGLDEPGLSRYLIKMNLVLIKEAPLHYLKEVASAITLYWFPSTTPLSNFDSRSLQMLWSVIHIIIVLTFFAVIFLLASLLVMRWFLPRDTRGWIDRNRDGIQALLPVLLVPLSIIVYTMLVSTFFEAGHQRYRAPTELLIFFIIVLGIHFLVRVRSEASDGRAEQR